MKTFNFLIIGWFPATMLLADGGSDTDVGKKIAVAPTENSSQFYIEKGLVDKVYQQTTSLEAERHRSPGSLLPNIGILSAKEFELANEYFAIDYADQMGTIPFVGFALTSEIARVQRVAFSLKGEFGYSYKQGTFNATSSSGSDIEDTITLQWVPVMAGLSVEYTPSWATWIKPSIETLGGAHWLHHTGTLDGLDQSIWVPVYGGGMSLALFPGVKDEDGVFGGITVGANYLQSSNSEQNIRGWIYKVGSSILL